VGEGEGWNTERNYKIPSGVLERGKNSISVQITGSGGIGRDAELFLQSGGEKIDLRGTWKFAIEKINTSGRSEYADGDNIISLFLKHYGPDAVSSEGNGEPVYTEKADKQFVIKTIKDQMKYDIEKIEASPGDLIEIKFVNDDAMQHNLLIVKPGKLAIVGSRAEEFAKDTNAAERNYTPDMPEILAIIPMINPGKEYTLQYRIPDRVGNYPFVCTFPGHWQTMNGVIVVREAS